jgi:hypothetical protein
MSTKVKLNPTGQNPHLTGFLSVFALTKRSRPNSVVFPALLEIIRKCNSAFIMKKMSRFVFIQFLFLAMLSLQNVLAGNCGPTGCNLTYVAPSRQPASTVSTSHAFTAIGGSRVANINLSQEARDRLSEEEKTEPSAKVSLTAADRTKLTAKQTPLYGWPEDESPRLVSRPQSHSSIATQASRNSRSKILRSRAVAAKSVTAISVATAGKASSRH